MSRDPVPSPGYLRGTSGQPPLTFFRRFPLPYNERVAFTQKMPEAEVTLRVAFWLLDSGGPHGHADVAIDGAHVRIAAHTAAGAPVKERLVFGIKDYLLKNECRPKRLKDDWRGEYVRNDCTLTIGSVHGFDVHFRSADKSIKVECKGGLLQPTGKSASAILTTAIGQVITSDSIFPSDELWGAVPDSPAFEKTGVRIAKGEVFSKTGIRIALVSGRGVRLLQQHPPVDLPPET